MGDSTPNEPQDKDDKEDPQDTKGFQGGNEIIPLAAAAFLGALAGAVLGSAIS